MLALVAALMLTSPAPGPACDEWGYPITPACRASCAWWSKVERRCRDVDVEVIGSWDPRPAPHEWPSTMLLNPPDWPAYRLEKANAQ